MQLIRITNAELRSSMGTADKYWHLQGNITKEIFDKLYNNEEEMKKKVVINAELVGSPSIVMGTGKIVGVGRTIIDEHTQYLISVRGNGNLVPI